MDFKKQYRHNCRLMEYTMEGRNGIPNNPDYSQISNSCAPYRLLISGPNCQAVEECPETMFCGGTADLHKSSDQEALNWLGNLTIRSQHLALAYNYYFTISVVYLYIFSLYEFICVLLILLLNFVLFVIFYLAFFYINTIHMQ